MVNEEKCNDGKPGKRYITRGSNNEGFRSNEIVVVKGKLVVFLFEAMQLVVMTGWMDGLDDAK